MPPVRPLLLLLLTAGIASASAAEELATPNFKTPSAKATKASTRDSGKPAAKAGGPRRPGELEGWDKSEKSAASEKSKLPPGAIGERRVPDGGLPLPERRFTETPGMGQAPIQFDQNGNMGGAFRF